MILRRFTQHVKDQNWTAVGLDFFIVVIGVFIGIQVSNWNAERADRFDESVFLARLHDDIVRVVESSARLRERRIASIDHLQAASEKIFSTDLDALLTRAECQSLATSHYYNINVLGLPSLVELTNAGRVGILRDRALSTALVAYQQTSDNLSQMIRFESQLINNLVMLNPKALAVTPVFDTELGEFQTLPDCNVAAMREDPFFLNGVAENLDSYDAYLRDGLLPWNHQLVEIHRLVDAALDITHEDSVK